MSKTITPEILHGQFVGTLKGICAWDIPQQLKEKLERQIKELEGMEAEKQKPKLKSTLRFSHSGQIFDIVITSDHTDEKTFNHVIREKLFSKDMWLYVLSCNQINTDKQIKELEETQVGNPLLVNLHNSGVDLDEVIKKWLQYPQYYLCTSSDETTITDVNLLKLGNEDIFDTTSMD